jgi:CheY-like chemotaxis protein/tetratricopeptide (TPR) repeat protein
MPTILIVDDDKHTRALLERIVRFDGRLSGIPGLKILQAADGEEGLKLFEAEKPDVVVTDLLMPRLDGFKLCQAVRERDPKRTVGLLVVSGVYRDKNVAVQLKQEFGADFYTKPYQIKDLVTQLARILIKPAATSAAAPGASPPPPAPPPPVPADERPRQGGFADTPLPRLLLDLYEGRATGILEMRRGRIEKRIDLVVGHPVAVSSNQRHEMLGHFLVRRKVITEEQHQQALERASNEGEKIGEALREMKLLGPADLLKQLTAQARFKITGALRWPDGAWSFQPNRDLTGRPKANALDPVMVVLVGLKKTSAPETAARAVAGLAGRKVALTARGERLKAQAARILGEDLLRGLADRPVLDRLLETIDPRVAMPGLEALLLCGCVEGQGRAATPDVAGFVARVIDPLNLGELSSARAGGSAAGAAAGGEAVPTAPLRDEGTGPVANLYEQLFGEDEISGVAKLPAPIADGAIAARAPAASSRPVPRGSSSPTTVAGAATAAPSAGAPSPGAPAPHVEVGDGVPDAALAGTDSAVIEVGAFGSGPTLVRAATESGSLREALVAEYLRIQSKDLYAVLSLRRDAPPEEIDAEFTTHMAAFSLEKHQAHDVGNDHGKLEEIHAAYRRAYETLSSPSRRRIYDRELADKEKLAPPSPMSAELDFLEGERHLQGEEVRPAIERFRRALSAAPDVADYNAALGWALHLAGTAEPGHEGREGKEGMAYLEQALAIDPDHPAAHEYLGRLLARSGRDDDNAARHLEKALDAQPPRVGALTALEELRQRRGELGLLERRYRKLLHVAQRTDPKLALRLWLALAGVFLSALDDRDAARTAYQCALRYAPDDPSILEALAELHAGDPSRFKERAEALRARWRVEPQLAGPGLELLRAAEDSVQPDAAAVVAGALTARGQADEQAEKVWRRHRPRFLLRAQRAVDHDVWRDVWRLVRHGDDDPELGEVFALLEPTALATYALGLGDLEIGEAALVPEADVPEPLIKVRDYLAGVLDVPRAQVAQRADFGDQAHVGGTSPPLLLVGPKLFASQDKVAMAFHLARAMTYLRPGRTIGGSRPSRVLKALFTAAMSLINPQVHVEADATLIEARRAVDALPLTDRDKLGELAARITAARSSINLSRWARALARTADRVGLLLTGDVPGAAAAVRALASAEAVDDLIDWAIGPDHLAARAALGLSVDV